MKDPKLKGTFCVKQGCSSQQPSCRGNGTLHAHSRGRLRIEATETLGGFTQHFEGTSELLISHRKVELFAIKPLFFVYPLCFI